jgi:hypothetical protein
VLGALIAGLALWGAEAWAIVAADVGGVWVQAQWKDKIQLTNILSRELGGDPGMYLNCLEKTFQDPANATKTIMEAAKECKAAAQQ